MASENLNVGTAANANDGDTLRAAFIKVKKMFADIYGQTYSEQGDLSGTDYKVKASQVKTTNSAGSGVDGYVLTYDHSSGGFTFEEKFDGDITGIVAGAGLTGSSLNTDDATLNVIGGDGITVNADEVEATVDGTTLELSASDGSGAIRIKDLGVSTAKIAGSAVTTAKINDDAVTNAKMADDAIDHAQLAARYTESGTLTDGSSITVDTGAKNIYTHTITQATTFNFTNAAIGQVHTLVITGDGSNGITLGTINSNSSTFRRIGSGTFDEANAVKNLIEIKFISTSEAWYQISQEAS